MLDNDLSTQNTYLDSESNLLEEVMDEPISELDSSSENELHAFDDVSSDNLLDFSSEYVASSDWDASQFDGWGDPIADASYWQQQEGQNSCAVVAQISVYEAIAGVNISEAQACQIAEVNGWFDSEAGTSPEHVGKILNALGIPTEQTYDATLDDIATALEQGDKVIVGLDACEIWNPMRDPVTGFPIEQVNGGHAVWVTGIDQQPDGSVKIILNDSGIPNGQMIAVDAEDFLNAWSDYGNFLVVADAPSVNHSSLVG